MRLMAGQQPRGAVGRGWGGCGQLWLLHRVRGTRRDPPGPAPGGHVLPAGHGEGGRWGGRSSGGRTCSRPSPPAPRPPGSRSWDTCAGRTRAAGAASPGEAMEGDALLPGTDRCGATSEPGAESRAGTERL